MAVIEKEKAAERYEKRTFPEGWTIRKAFLAGWDERDKEVAELKTKLAWAENGARLR